MQFEKLDIDECWKVLPNAFEDERGLFVKNYNSEMFRSNGIDIDIKEEFYSVSKKNVFRGLHFQVPPDDHSKLVYCLKGKILDLFLDLRKGSSTYLQIKTEILSEDNRAALLLPKGIAHGFLSLVDESIVVYKTSSVYSPENDAGVHWEDFRSVLPIENPIVSARDDSFPKIADYNSPF